MIYILGRSMYFSKAIWIAFNETEPSKGMWVLHKCNNELCVNPAHLKLGTPKENVQDAKDRGLDGPWYRAVYKYRRPKNVTPVQP